MSEEETNTEDANIERAGKASKEKANTAQWET
jgi:hypothetical protein